MPDDDEAARKAARGRSEHASYPGIPTRHLKQMVMGQPKVPPPLAPTVPPPVPMQASDLDTPAEPIRVRAREREQTRVGIGVPPLPPVQARARRATETGLAPPAPGSAPVPSTVNPENSRARDRRPTLQETPQIPQVPAKKPAETARADVDQREPASAPPASQGARSVSPIPWDPASSSQEARREAARHGDRVVDQPPRSVSPAPTSTVNLPDGSRINRKTLSKLWLWVGPVALSVLGTAFGYVRGYAQGLSDALEKVARIETRQDAHAVRMAKAETRIEGVENGLAKEENSNRSERATALARHNALVSDVEALKKAVPKIEGLAPK